MGLSKKITLKCSCSLSDVKIDVNEITNGLVNVYGRTIIKHENYPDKKWVVTFVDTNYIIDEKKYIQETVTYFIPPLGSITALFSYENDNIFPIGSVQIFDVISGTEKLIDYTGKIYLVVLPDGKRDIKIKLKRK